MKKLLLLLLFIPLVNCSDDSEESCESVPQLTTLSVSNITDISVELNGEIVPPTCDTSVISQGFVYAKTTLPQINDSNVVEVNGDNITTTITELEQNTIYYYRTFYENNDGEYYGNEIQFSTEIGAVLIDIIDITNITSNSSLVTSTISSNGGSDILEKGVCWNTSGSPTVSDNSISNDDNSDNFSSLLENLNSNSTYFVKSYAQNQQGITYSNELSFTTLCESIDVTTSQELLVENGVISVYLDYNISNSEFYNITNVNVILDDGINTFEQNFDSLQNQVVFSDLIPFTTYSAQLLISSDSCDNITANYDNFTAPVRYQIGEEAEGGIIIYMESNGINGIAASKNDAGSGSWACDTYNSSSLPWDGYYTFGNNINDWEGNIGDGEDSSNAILNFLNNGTGNSADGYFANFCDCIESYKAVEVADNYNAFGYSDWYLPHIKTLDLIYNLYTQGIITNFNNVDGCGAGAEPIYWSSCGDGANGGWINFNLTGNNAGTVGKGSFFVQLNVRPVRKF